MAADVCDSGEEEAFSTDSVKGGLEEAFSREFSVDLDFFNFKNFNIKRISYLENCGSMTAFYYFNEWLHSMKFFKRMSGMPHVQGRYLECLSKLAIFRVRGSRKNSFTSLLFFLNFIFFNSILSVSFATTSVTSPIITTTPASPVATIAQSIQRFELKNGLQIYVLPEHRAPVLVNSIWYRVGSGYEQDGYTGLSHLLEHLMFQGTRLHPQGEFSKLIAALGGQDNAYTTSDYTVYFQLIGRQHLEKCFELEADRMQHVMFTPELFKKELNVVKEERRMTMDNDPNALTFERFGAAAHLISPYHHPIIGWMNDLNHIQMNDALNWYRKWYTPNNAFIVVVGDVVPEKVRDLAEKYFAAIPGREVPLLKPLEEPTPLGTRSVTVSVPAKLPFYVFGFNAPSLTTTREPKEAYALEILAVLLGDSDYGRLSEILLRKEQVISSVDTNYDFYQKWSGLFTIGVIPVTGQTIAAIQAQLEKQIQHLQKENISEAELSRAKAAIIASNIYAQDSLLGQTLKIGTTVILGLPLTALDDYVSQIKAVTPEQVRLVAMKYLTPERLTIGRLQPRDFSAAKAATPNQSSSDNTKPKVNTPVNAAPQNSH